MRWVQLLLGAATNFQKEGKMCSTSVQLFKAQGWPKGQGGSRSKEAQEMNLHYLPLCFGKESLRLSGGLAPGGKEPWYPGLGCTGEDGVTVA